MRSWSAPGSYIENIDLSGKAVTLRAAARTTIISGSGSADSTIKCISGEGAGTVIDGFRIQLGSGSTVAQGIPLGGGIYIDNVSSPTIRRCILIANDADLGGGMYVGTASNPVVSECQFVNNDAADSGAGLCVENLCSPVFTNCLFRGNDAVASGGAAMIRNSTPGFFNCTVAATTRQPSCRVAAAD